MSKLKNITVRRDPAGGTTQKSKLFERIYEIVRGIPPGSVAVYGQVAELVGTKDARKVGWALHANRDSETPCHRVVDRDGRLAPNFAFDGAKEQRRRLSEEGVRFIDDMHVDLKDCQWKI